MPCLICDMTGSYVMAWMTHTSGANHSRVWRDLLWVGLSSDSLVFSSIYYIFRSTYSWVSHIESYATHCNTLLQHTATHDWVMSDVRQHHSFICVTRLTHTRGVKHSFFPRKLLICSMWLTLAGHVEASVAAGLMCASGRGLTGLPPPPPPSLHLYVWHNRDILVPWPICV